MKSARHHCLRAMGLLLGASVLHPAAATDWRADVQVGAMYTDNLRRTDASPESASVQYAATHFFVRQNTRTIFLDADGGITFRRYDVDGVDDDVLPALRARLDWVLVPEVLGFVFTDNLGQRARNSNGGLVPLDRENQNVFTAGPDMRFGFGGGSAIVLSGRYSMVNYEVSPNDSRKRGGELGYERILDSGATVGLIGSSSRTEFTDADGGYDLHSVFMKYAARSRRTAIEGSIGGQSLHDGGEARSGFFGDIRLERRVSRQTVFSLDAVSRFADTADVFQRRQDLEPDVDVIVDTVAGQAALKQFAVTAAMTRDGPRARLEASIGYFNENSRNNDVVSNRSGTSVSMDVEYIVGPRLTVNGVLGASREAPELERAFFNTNLELGLEYELSQNFSLLGGAQYFRRTGGGQTFAGFDETRAFLTLQWRKVRMGREFTGQAIGSPSSRRLVRIR